MNAPYTLWLLLFNVAPVTLLWTFFFKELRVYWSVFVFCISCSIIVGVLWDFFAIHNQIWYWPPSCCALPRVNGLPLEEPIFMAFTSALIIAMTILCRDAIRTHRKHLRKAKQ